MDQGNSIKDRQKTIIWNSTYLIIHMEHAMHAKKYKYTRIFSSLMLPVQCTLT